MNWFGPRAASSPLTPTRHWLRILSCPNCPACGHCPVALRTKHALHDMVSLCWRWPISCLSDPHDDRNRADTRAARAMSLPREVVPGRFYMTPRRCTQRQFLLRPDEETNNAFLYCLAEAAQRFDIAVLLTCAMSNHHHTVSEGDVRLPHPRTHTTPPLTARALMLSEIRSICPTYGRNPHR